MIDESEPRAQDPSPPPEKPEIAPPPPDKPEIAPPPPDKPEIAPPPPDKPEAPPPSPEAPEIKPPPDKPEVELPPEKPEAQTAPSAESPVVVRREVPRVASVTPAESFLAGGLAVTITGTGFERGCAVKVFGVALPEVTFDSETTLRVIMPRRSEVGPVAITIVNPTGLAHCAQDIFTYVRTAPRIDSVWPSSGPSSGGTRLTIKGDGFGPGSSVFICGIATPMKWRSSDEIEAITPAVSRDGPADVRVVNGDDDQAHTIEKAFRYIAPLPPPQLSAVSPSRGPQAGGLKVAILGDDFADGVVVRFGGVDATATFLTRKELSALIPPCGRAGDVDVEVINPDGATAKLEDAFTYEAPPAPQITSVEPKNGPTIGGTKLIIEGINFVRESQVYIGREYPKDLVFKSATEIHAVTPSRKTPGVVDVEVTSPGVPKAVKSNAFRYDAVPAPTIGSVSPNRVGTSGGTAITVSGTNFLKETAVLVDNKPVKGVKFVDKSTLEFKAPGGSDGKMADVTVRNPDGKEAVQKRAFVFDPRYG